MPEAPTPEGSPLSLEVIARIDATLLPSQERHHLRLMAHCLACFQDMANGRDQGPLPSAAEQRSWCQQHPQLQDDAPFARLLLQQFQSAGRQLESLAAKQQITPLGLTLDHLIEDAVNTHRLRSS